MKDFGAQYRQREVDPEDFVRALAGDVAARNRIVEANMPLVVSVAKRYRRRGLRRGLLLADLVQLGAMGMMRAAEKFDPAREMKFSTYATIWIRQKICLGISENGLIRIPTTTRQQHESRTRRNEHSPSRVVLEEAQRLQVEEMWTREGKPRPLAAPVEEDPQLVTEATVALEKAIGCLGRRELMVLQQRYWQQLTLAEVGVAVGVTKERVRQIQRDAEKKLKRAMVAQEVRAELKGDAS